MSSPPARIGFCQFMHACFEISATFSLRLHVTDTCICGVIGFKKNLLSKNPEKQISKISQVTSKGLCDRAQPATILVTDRSVNYEYSIRQNNSEKI